MLSVWLLQWGGKDGLAIIAQTLRAARGRRCGVPFCQSVPCLALDLYARGLRIEMKDV